jgi:hypothetical protein
MGGQNVLYGTVESLAGGIATLAGLAGERFALRIPDGRLLVGSQAYFAVRRDQVRLMRDGAAGTPSVNMLRARIAATEFQGIYVKVTLAIEQPAGHVNGAEEFVSYAPESEFFREELKIGDPVIACWQIDDVRLLSGDSKARPKH